jgi:predicted transcriptional regulator
MVTPLTPLLGRGQRRDLQPRSELRRQCLLATIREHPGLTFRGVCRVSGVAAGIAQHHLGSLRGHDLVVAFQVGTTIRYFPSGWNAAQAAVRVLEESSTMARVLEVLKGQRLTQKAVLDAAGLPRATSQHALARLVRAGAVAVHAQGRYRFYEVTL